jgi:hypothetical protein
MLHINRWSDDQSKFIEEPVTLPDIQRILKESRVIDIAAKEELPKGKVTFVGLSNHEYECKTLYDLAYTNHDRLTYGGYFMEDHSGYNAWWTMNYNFSELLDKTKMYVVKSEEDGRKLAAFMNFIRGFNNIDKTIQEKEQELKSLREDIEFIKEAKQALQL